jgi:hypothetical protein
MDQMAIKYANIFHWKTQQNLPNLKCLVWNHTIWQPQPPSAIITQWIDTCHLFGRKTLTCTATVWKTCSPHFVFHFGLLILRS